MLYVLMLAATVAAFFVVRAIGMTLTTPAGLAPVQAAGPKPHDSSVFHILLAMAVVIAAARGFGAIFARIHQPAVVGEVLAGIVLGPSVLGQIAPDAASYILPASVAPYLATLAQIGVILYMFLVGLELDEAMLAGRTRATVLVSHMSIIVPFVLGCTVALFFYTRLAPPGVPFTIFALFLGVSMSVTAFPVLARILTDRRLHTTPLGAIAITCAAVDDVTAWCLLALLVSVAQAEPRRVVITVLLTLVYIAFMLVALRPFIVRWIKARDAKGLTREGMSVVCVALFVSTLVTEYIGIHALFGAFLLGALAPAGSRMASELTNKLEDVVVVLFLPAFFAYTGMRTQIGLLDTATDWIACGAIIVVATIGKFGGSAVAARLTGMSRRDSAALGILMNTRGLMELIVLNIGLDLGVISPALFAMLVIMALVTTFATTPMLDAVYPQARAARIRQPG